MELKDIKRMLLEYLEKEYTREQALEQLYFSEIETSMNGQEVYVQYSNGTIDVYSLKYDKLVLTGGY